MERRLRTLRAHLSSASDYDAGDATEVPPLPPQRSLAALRSMAVRRPLGRGHRRSVLFAPAERSGEQRCFLDISNGHTHVRLFGPHGGGFDPRRRHTLVLVHGISFPSPVFHALVEALREREPALQVVSYDLFGQCAS